MSDTKQNKKPMSQRKRVIVFVLLSFLALVVCMSVVMSVALSMITDGVYDYGEGLAQSLTRQPANPAEAVAYVSSLVNTANDDTNLFVKINTSVGIEDNTLTCDGDESELKILDHMKNTVLGAVDKLYPEDYTGKFGNDYRDFPRINLSEGEYLDAHCTLGRLNEYDTLVDTEYYFSSITVKGVGYTAVPGSGAYETFRMGDDSEIAEKIKAESAELCDIVSCKLSPLDFYIEAKSDRLTDKLLTISFTHRYAVELTLSFKGDLESVGTRTVGFNYYVSEAYEYVWAGITCQETLTLQKGDEQQLAVSAKLNDYEDYTVRFKSSDESVATIDEIGYITALKESEEPVTITVYLDYLGHEYSAECELKVLIPVKKITISDKELSLSVGEAADISTALKPKEATDKDIIWISDNEAVATVTPGADGTAVINAVSTGSTEIHAVTDDGDFQAICTVTVSE